MGLLNIGISSLLSNQTAINTTGNNIANAQVDGYTRQQAEFNTRNSRLDNGGFLGTGVDVATVRRITDQFINQQILIDQSKFSKYEILSSNMSTLDKLIGGSDTGLAKSLNSFFSSLNDAISQPSAIPQRQVFLSEAENLTQRFNQLTSYMKNQRSMVNQQINLVVNEIDTLAKEIASLNVTISQRTQNNIQPNDLLDKRDVALKSLAKLVSFSTTNSPNDLVNIFIGSGQPLVLEGKASSIATIDISNNSSDKIVSLSVDNQEFIINNGLSDGEIGGLLYFRDQILNSTQSKIDLLAISLNQMINIQHRAGINLEGLPGGDLFTSINSDQLTQQRITSSSDNLAPQDRELRLIITDSSKLTTENYQLVFSGSQPLNYSLTSSDSNQVILSGLLSDTLPQTIETNLGFSINLDSGSFQAGDNFIIEPIKFAAESLSLSLRSPQGLALGAPLIFSSGQLNTGDGYINQNTNITVGDLDNKSLIEYLDQGGLSTPLLIKFTSSTSYDVLDNSDPNDPKEFIPPIRNQQFSPNESNILLNFKKDSNFISSSAPQVFTAEVGAIGSVTNGYPGSNILTETLNITSIDPVTGETLIRNIDFSSGQSSYVISQRLNTVDNINATASTSVELSISNDNDTDRMSISLNGIDITEENLLDGIVDPPVSIQSLVTQINEKFSDKSIFASVVGSGQDLRLLVQSFNGEDLKFTNNSIDDDSFTITRVNEGQSVNNLVASGEEAVIGGVVDIILDPGTSINTSGGLFSGATIEEMSVYLGGSVELTGTPNYGDVFSIGLSQELQGDNRNGLSLIKLQDIALVENNLGTFSQFVSSINTEVGNITNQVEQNYQAAESLLNQIISRRESISGVNLDEEAANLIQFQHSYAASAQVISTARTIFDSLLNIFD